MLQGVCLDSEILPVGATFFLFQLVPIMCIYPDSHEKVHTKAVIKRSIFGLAEVNETPEWQPEPPKRSGEIEKI
ncbi:hypothetical protein [Domibacillus iocasae]|uniref:Uncharacterized protein n=1 Tax=Domibacillus iocasae TaxID=1714016 RepID=A0A1E7DSV6_9BACI|nr:hypothetical protein [Domibacillus iocasae]OES46150.1 hypothetical protein BA724_16370 [Domibacillus iocasae]